MPKADEQLISIIKDIVHQELEKSGLGGAVLCRVVRRRDETHYDLALMSDLGNEVTNVPNMTHIDLTPGDRVYIYKIGGRLDNAFICCKAIPAESSGTAV